MIDNNKLIADMFYFIIFAYENDLPENIILETLVHDIAGVYNKKRCFLPRVDGYYDKFIKEDKSC